MQTKIKVEKQRKKTKNWSKLKGLKKKKHRFRFFEAVQNGNRSAHSGRKERDTAEQPFDLMNTPHFSSPSSLLSAA